MYFKCLREDVKYTTVLLMAAEVWVYIREESEEEKHNQIRERRLQGYKVFSDSWEMLGNCWEIEKELGVDHGIMSF